MAQRVVAYSDFWIFYLREHSRAGTRAMHYAGTAAALAALGVALITVNPWWVLAAVAAGYGPAWAAHAFIEHNRPATLTYPVWSLLSDVRMFFSWLTGGIDAELDRAGVRPADPHSRA